MFLDKAAMRVQSYNSSHFENWVQQTLFEFIESDHLTLTFLSVSTERGKKIQEMAISMNLKARITRSKENKNVIVKRCRRSSRKDFLEDSKSLELDSNQKQILFDYFRKYGVNLNTINQYFSKGYATSQRDVFSNFPSSSTMLVPPHVTIDLDSRIQRFRTTLPAYKMRDHIIQTIRNNQVTIITGGTGCGKTTQVPQFILEEATFRRQPIRIFCTQPRRLPAVTVAGRVAAERNEELGRTVGYHIRLEQKTSNSTILTYSTSGVLLRLLSDKFALENISHVILDEIHEREQRTDFLLIILRKALRYRNDLKVILMSATLGENEKLFTTYFNNTSVGFVNIPSNLFHVEVLHLPEILALTDYLSNFHRNHEWISGSLNDLSPFTESNRNNSFDPQMTMFNTYTNNQLCNANFGRSFPNASNFQNNCWYSGNFYTTKLPYRPLSFEPICVAILRETKLDTRQLVDSYLSNCYERCTDGIDIDLIVAVIKYCIDSPINGAILVFLPGYDDLISVAEKIKCIQNGFKRKPFIYLLHSQIGNQDQLKVFQPAAYQYRKVILSTNIAEASLTIDDVVFVIDCGKVKEKGFNHLSRISELREVWIAKSNAQQRTGRAGRCRNGYCFRLYTIDEYDMMSSIQKPEMQRIAIHEVCLHAKMFCPRNMTIHNFLSLAPEPPSSESVEKSVEFLEMLGAFFQPSIGRRLNFQPGCTQTELSDLGFHIAHLPLEPQLARLLLFGIALKCLDPVITLVAVLSYRDPFILPASGDVRSRAAAAREIFAGTYCSDHLALIHAFYMYERHNRKPSFCREHFISLNSMRMIAGIRKQLFDELKRLNLLPLNCKSINDGNLNRYSHSWAMIVCAIVAGSYPGVGMTRRNNIRRILTNNVFGSVKFGSAICRSVIENRDEICIDYIVYQDIYLTSGDIQLRTASVASPLSVFLFAGPLHLQPSIIEEFELSDEIIENGDDNDCCDNDNDNNDDWETFSNYGQSVFELDPYLYFKSANEELRLLLKFRIMLMSYFLDVMKHPNYLEENEQCQNLLSTLEKIISEDFKRKNLPLCNLPLSLAICEMNLLNSSRSDSRYQSSGFESFTRANYGFQQRATNFEENVSSHRLIVDTKDEETKDETASGNIDQFFNNSTEKSSCTLNNQFCSKDSEKIHNDASFLSNSSVNNSKEPLDIVRYTRIKKRYLKNPAGKPWFKRTNK